MFHANINNASFRRVKRKDDENKHLEISRLWSSDSESKHVVTQLLQNHITQFRRPVHWFLDQYLGYTEDIKKM